jgi:hypothetical protein
MSNHTTTKNRHNFKFDNFKLFKISTITYDTDRDIPKYVKDSDINLLTINNIPNYLVFNKLVKEIIRLTGLKYYATYIPFTNSTNGYGIITQCIIVDTNVISHNDQINNNDFLFILHLDVSSYLDRYYSYDSNYYLNLIILHSLKERIVEDWRQHTSNITSNQISNIITSVKCNDITLPSLLIYSDNNINNTNNELINTLNKSLEEPGLCFKHYNNENNNENKYNHAKFSGNVSNDNKYADITNNTSDESYQEKKTQLLQENNTQLFCLSQIKFTYDLQIKYLIMPTFRTLQSNDNHIYYLDIISLI